MSQRRVVKVGGSLLDWPRLGEQLQLWLAGQTPAMNVVVVGGGEFAEQVRRLDGIHHLSPRDAHWLAAETMQITAKFVGIILTGSEELKRFDKLTARCESSGEPNRPVILDPLHFLRNIEPKLPGERLPQDWTATSDSIAARLAVALDAEELVLLKSTLPAGVCGATTIVELAAAGYVDAALPRMAAGLERVRCVNLRDEGFAECRFIQADG